MSWPPILTSSLRAPSARWARSSSMARFINDQITKFSETFDRLSQMNPRMALFIIRVCPFVPKFTFVLRCSHLWKFEYLFSFVDDMIRDTLIEILNCPLNDCSWFQASLPVQFVGLYARKISNVVVFFVFETQCAQTFRNIITYPSLDSVALMYLAEVRMVV